MATASGAQAQPEDLAQLLELLPDVGLFLTSADGTILSFNPGAEALTGVAAAAALGQPVARICVPHAADVAQRSRADDSADYPHPADLSDLEAAARRGKAGMELQLVRADASRLWVNARVCSATQGRFAVQLVDITARKQAEAERAALLDAQQQAEAARRLSEERFKLLLQATDHAIWERDLETGELWWKDIFAALFGHPPEELAPGTESWMQLVHPQDSARVTAELQQVLDSGGASWSSQYRLRRHNGSFAEVAERGYVLRNAAGRAVRMLGVIRDITDRELIEKAVRDNEARYARAVRGTSDGLWDWTVDGSDAYLSPRWKELLGFAENELPNHRDTVHGLLHPEDLQLVCDGVKAHFEHGAPYDLQVRLRTKSGQYRWFRLRGEAERDEHGRPVRMAGFISDITEQKRAADDVRQMNAILELRVAERTLQMQRFMELIEASTDFVGMGHPDLRPFYFNRAFREAIGLPAEVDFSTLKVSDFHTPATMARITTEAIPAVLRDGSWLGESELQRADGSVIPVSQLIIGHFDKSGKLEHLSTIMRNETGRRKMEAELRASQERLLLATEAAQIGIWDWNIVDDVLSWDAVMYRLYGITQEQFGGNCAAWLAGVHPEDRAAMEEQGRLALQQRREHSMQFRVLRPDQTVRTLCNHYVVHRDEAGRPVRMVGTNWDITEMKQSEQAIRALNEKLQRRTTEVEEANRELEAFSYSVSHDLRAPLRAIDGFSRIVLEEYGGQLPAEAQEYLRDILANTQRMGQLVDDLLAFARLNRQPLQKRTVAVDKLISQCLAELQPRPQTEPRPQLTVAELPPCSADPALLKQVWLNLVENALKYSQVRRPAVIEIGATTQAHETVYFIKDNGVGFDMRYADKLFGVFQRLHRQEDYEGTGVGLAIVQRVIHRHGGRVWAQAQVDHGATFYFSLPVG